jgi:aryl-alcohol dehydrogenase-like predicted oxidoreductase
MKQLKDTGKIRAIGISIPDEGIADANVHIEAKRVDVIQCVYNIFQQEPEYSLFPLARKHQIGIIARSPFSSGALTGSWKKDMQFEDGDWRGIWPKNIKENWLEEQVDMASALIDIINPEGIDMIDASINYILKSNDISSVIPGSANPEHVKYNFAAINPTLINDDVYIKIKDLWSRRIIHGTYNGSI